MTSQPGQYDFGNRYSVAVTVDGYEQLLIQRAEQQRAAYAVLWAEAKAHPFELPGA